MTTDEASRRAAPNPPVEARKKLALTRHVVLVGLMGAGKSAVGRRLASVVGAPFMDADDAIVEAAGMSIPDIFASHGEPEFRAVERRVIARLLVGQPHFLALGGGAFMDPATRERVAARGYSIWLRADLDTLVARTGRKKGTRPLLDAGDPRGILADLMERRYPVYAEADLTVDTGDQPLDVLVLDLVERLRQQGILV
jgi:shikimate kinase